MKTQRILFIAGILAIGMTIHSCKKENHSSGVGFKMKATGTQFNPGVLKSAGNTSLLALTWDTANIIVNKLELEAKYKSFTDSTSLSMKVDYEWHGNQTLDLLGEPPVFATLDLPDGIYEEIEMKVLSRAQLTSGIPNFYLAGSLTADTVVYPVLLMVTDDFTIGTEVEDWEINSQTGGYYDGLITLSLQQIFSDITLDDLMGAELINGRIIISSDVNKDLYSRILSNMHRDGECHGDWDWGHGWNSGDHGHDDGHHGGDDDEGDGD